MENDSAAKSLIEDAKAMVKAGPSAAEKAAQQKINYSALEHSRTKMLQDQLKTQLRSREVGRDMSLRRVVLRLTVDGQYDDAASMVDVYLNHKRVYPALFGRCEPHANHAKELINAVRAKRNFPNLSSLSISKQQEILDNAIGHFDELKITLKTIEHMVKDEAVLDIRSSIYVVRTGVYAVFAVIATALLIEFTEGGLGMLMWSVFWQAADDVYVKVATAVGIL